MGSRYSRPLTDDGFGCGPRVLLFSSHAPFEADCVEKPGTQKQNTHEKALIQYFSACF